MHRLPQGLHAEVQQAEDRAEPASEPASEPDEISAAEYFKDAGRWYRFDRPLELSGGAYRCLAEEYYYVDKLRMSLSAIDIYRPVSFGERQYNHPGVSPPGTRQVIEQLDSDCPEARLAAAVWLFDASRLWWFAALDESLREKVETKAVRVLGEKLRSEHQPIRREAALALIRMRSAVGNRPLIEVLEGEDLPVKEDVISVVGDKFDEWHAADRFSTFPFRLLLKYDMYRWKVETLIENLKGTVGDPPEASDPTVVTEPPGATILGGWDGMSAEARDKYVRDAIEELREGDWKSRMQATRMLDEAKGDRRAVGALVFALRDDIYQVRAAAARALGRLDAKSAAEPLLFALRDEHKEVSSAAIEALGRIGDERALALAMQMARDADGDRRRSAVLALSYFARPESVDLLIDALDEKDHELVMAAVAALGSIDDPRVNKALVQFVNSNASSDARSVAVQAIVKRKDSVAMQGMLKALREGDEVAQVMAFTVLAQWNDPQSLGPLLKIAG